MSNEEENENENIKCFSVERSCVFMQRSWAHHQDHQRTDCVPVPCLLPSGLRTCTVDVSRGW